MDEPYWAKRFSEEVDGLLNESKRIPSAIAPAAYVEALNLARTLASWDFSAESRRRETLRRRLLAEASHDTVGKERNMTALNWRRISVLTAVGTLLVLTLAIGLFYPGGIAAAAQQMFEAIQTIFLGDYSRAVQVEPGASTAPSPIPADLWIVRTEIGNFAGNAPPGVDPVVVSLNSLEEAQAAVDLHVVTPTYLPEGYALREIKLAPIGGTHWVFSFFSGPAHDIILAQMPSGPQPSPDPYTVSGVFSGIVTDGTLEATDFDGRPAVWIESHSLMWAVDHMTYEVGGLDLALEEARQIARSLR